MTSSNQGKNRDDGPPLRSTGRTFASIDPERVREVVPGTQTRGGAHDAGHPPANDEAARRAGVPVRRQVTEGGSATGGEGGRGRRQPTI